MGTASFQVEIGRLQQQQQQPSLIPLSGVGQSLLCGLWKETLKLKLWFVNCKKRMRVST